tara:strand:+ start:55 stop:723 length:669 start_codon:yes stop_codon:yes gene_type:complete
MNLENFLNTSVEQLSIAPTLFSFLLCVLMSFIVRDIYIRRSFSLTGKMHIGSIIPVLSAVVFLVIVIVKSSLALSLGLVGALSIVRFRTPIKEPEELVYLFLAIGLAIGYAAGQILITTILVLLTLAIIYFWLSNNSISKTIEYNLVIIWKNNNVEFQNILDVINPKSDSVKLVRIDKNPESITAVMLISPKENNFLDIILHDLNNLDSEMKVTFFETKTNW